MIFTYYPSYLFTWLSAGAEMSWRPWTQGAKRVRYIKGVKRKLPEPIKKWTIVRGDTVSVDFYINHTIESQ